jgi:multimeric flavodoxin WrbA
MKAVVINGSPRQEGNTMKLLNKAAEGTMSVGAETEIIPLYKMNYKGCSSCFACKRKNSQFVGHCAMRDDLSAVLEKTIISDVLILGSPIYLGDITSEMRSFLERFVFMNLSYEKDKITNFTGRLSVGFIYTMGIPQQAIETSGYSNIFDLHRRYFQLFNGTAEHLISSDAYQFDDYSKYDASKYDEHHKAQVRATQFPIDCERAFEMGARLAANRC